MKPNWTPKPPEAVNTVACKFAKGTKKCAFHRGQANDAVRRAARSYNIDPRTLFGEVTKEQKAFPHPFEIRVWRGQSWAAEVDFVAPSESGCEFCEAWACPSHGPMFRARHRRNSLVKEGAYPI
jgi:hypothetical protein